MTLLPPSSRSAAVRGFQQAGLESTARRDLAGEARNGAGLGAEPVNSAKLGAGSTPSLPGTQRDDITQLEAPAWTGFSIRNVSTCRV